jgi:hypothetical protein
MLAYQAQTFDDILSGSFGVAYTDSRFDRLSGSTEVRAHQLVVTAVSGAPRLTVQIEHTSDGRTWIPRSGTPEVNSISIPAGAPSVFYISVDDSRAVPMNAFIRLKFSLDTGGGSAQIRAYTVGRTRRPGKTGPFAPGDDCGCKEGNGNGDPAPAAFGPPQGQPTASARRGPQVRSRIPPGMMSAAKPR